jgi:hypothetical protein
MTGSPSLGFPDAHVVGSVAERRGNVSLNFILRINDYAIGAFSAVRLEGSTDRDSLNTYRVRVQSRTNILWEDILIHRYGDGAWALVTKALAAFERQMEGTGESRADTGVPGTVHPQGSEPVAPTGSDALGSPQPRT